MIPSLVVGLIIIILSIIIIAAMYSSQSKTYNAVCPKCGKAFKPSTLQLVFSIHVLNKHILKCPYCGCKGLKEYKEISDK